MRGTSERNELWRGGNVGFRECAEQRHELGIPLEERRTVHLVRPYTDPRDMVRTAVSKVDSDPVTRAWGARKGEGASFNKEVFPVAIKRIGSPTV